MNLRRWQDIDEDTVKKLLNDGWQVFYCTNDDGFYIYWKRVYYPVSGKIYDVDPQSKKIYIAPSRFFAR